MYVSHVDSLDFSNKDIFQAPSDLFLRGRELETKAMKQKVIDLESGIVEQVNYENDTPILYTQKFRDFYLNLDVVRNRCFLFYHGRKNTGGMDLAYIQQNFPKLMSNAEKERVLQEVMCLQPRDLDLSTYFASVREKSSLSEHETEWLSFQLLPLSKAGYTRQAMHRIF